QTPHCWRQEVILLGDVTVKGQSLFIGRVPGGTSADLPRKADGARNLQPAQWPHTLGGSFYSGNAHSTLGLLLLDRALAVPQRTKCPRVAAKRMMAPHARPSGGCSRPCS